MINREVVDPQSGRTVSVLQRNGEPFMLKVTGLVVSLGSDVNDDGTLADDEWFTSLPEESVAKENILISLTRIRLSITRETATSDGEVTPTTLTRVILLRNRE